MKDILMVASSPGNLSALAAALEKVEPVSMSWADSSESAQDMVSNKTFHLAVIDETVAGREGLVVAKDLLMKNVMVNQAVVSRLSQEEFHEASEGLGVMARLSPMPHADEAKRLMDLLNAM